ncbi:AfsR/SARP family transcriptional regulator [Streptomyces lateritius]|uniref:AfsR/SARP family transcriptional regulator n=1 Tax=Streptomyces lateritius TaxID=67313 RepID=UPI0016722B2E|nr:AfsR/SARP family transcriptional regulator [Streptomyces lateritius]GGU04156.1 hypothetical protein GCM10010272_56710 [Streptomyces lateritius]
MSDPQHRLALYLLGPLRIWHEGRELAVGPPKQRAVLALLAGHRGTVVSREQIVDALWGADAPASAANAVHTYVAGLRRILEPERGSRESGAFIVSRAGGYELRLPAEAVDSLTFVRRYEEARALASAGRATAAFERFASALGLWRGEALSGIPGPYAALERARLREMRFSATEGWIAGLIAAGRHEAAVVACSEAIAQEPLHERLRHLHMLALARSGRQAHAIQAYDDARRHLREELGIDPGPELRDLHERILAGDIAIDTPPPVACPPGKTPATTGKRNPFPGAPESSLNQLPATARVFIGRESELQLGRQGLARENSPRDSTAAILTVDGPAGVGKTAFALELAHECAREFPDGQLYVDLRTTDDDGPRSPCDALGRLLQGLGVERDRLPHDLEGRIALYRGLMHGRRMLLLLDDADHAGQLRPLVPSGPSAVIVTSRRLQRGLLTREGARRIGLRPLDPRAAADLFVALVGPERCAGQREAVELLAEYCGRLPLGIRIAVGTMAANPYLSPGELAERYADPRTRLDQLSVEDDGASSVRRALAASYLALGEEEARFFRALGAAGGGAGSGTGAIGTGAIGAGAIGAAAASALTGGDPAAACRRLEALADVGLLERSGSDAYRFNELVAIYAAERAAAERVTADRVPAECVTAADQTGARPTQLLTPIRSDGFQGLCRPEALARR